MTIKLVRVIIKARLIKKDDVILDVKVSPDNFTAINVKSSVYLRVSLSIPNIISESSSTLIIISINIINGDSMTQRRPRTGHVRCLPSVRDMFLLPNNFMQVLGRFASTRVCNAIFTIRKNLTPERFYNINC